MNKPLISNYESMLITLEMELKNVKGLHLHGRMNRDEIAYYRQYEKHLMDQIMEITLLIGEQ